MHRMDLGLPDPATSALFAGSAQWIGAMVPKRWARRAVTRNLIKRQIHALADLGHLPPASGAVLVRLRASFHTGAFVSAASPALRQAVRAELLRLFTLPARRPEARA